MIKLVNRETNQNSYSIVKAFMGTFRAGILADLRALLRRQPQG